MRDIVCVSTNYWDGEWFRKQQFMSRFARDGHRVLFVNPSHSAVRHDNRPYVKNSIIPRLENRDGLFILTPAVQLPFVSRPFSEAVNQELLFHQVARTTRILGFDDPLVFVYPVQFTVQARRLTGGAVVVDIVDDYEGYDDREWRRLHARRLTMLAAKGADLTVYTCEQLREKYPTPGHSVVIPNGYDERVFVRDVAPVEQVAHARPVIGFVGTLFKYIDYELLSFVADSIPEATLVLVGRIEDPKNPKLNSLIQRTNVNWVGFVPRNRIPAFIAGFDVGLVPFKPGLVRDAVSPVKAYEYLAMGVPVVSTPIRSLMDDEACTDVLFASEPMEFVERVRETISLKPALDVSKIAAASWESRYQVLRKSLERVL